MKILIGIVALTLMGILPVQAAPLTEQDLTLEAPQCRTTKAKRPPLPAQKEVPYGNVTKADLNGDGWCDYAIGVPYPFNSQMSLYYLSEEMLLGSKTGWRRPFHGKRPAELSLADLNNEKWAWISVDLDDIQLIYPKAGGAPYVVGLYAGDQEFFRLPKWARFGGCQAVHLVQYKTVYRWEPSNESTRLMRMWCLISTTEHSNRTVKQDNGI